MLFKRSLLGAAFAVTSFTATAAPETFELPLQIVADIPSADGLKISDVGGWASREVRLVWDMASDDDLKPWDNQLDMKSGLGEINAYLLSQAQLTSAANTVDLNIAINGKPLAVGAANSVELLTDTEAAVGKRVSFVVNAVKPTAGYEQGDYSGTAFVMFESGV